MLSYTVRMHENAQLWDTFFFGGGGGSAPPLNPTLLAPAALVFTLSYTLFRTFRRLCWWSTRLRLTSKAIRWLHKSCASSITQDHETKTTLTNVQMSWTITSIRSSMPHYPVRIPGLRDFSSGVTVPTLNPVSPLITGLHFTLPTRVNFTIFSKY